MTETLSLEDQLRTAQRVISDNFRMLQQTRFAKAELRRELDEALAERDRARSTAVRLEQENARLEAILDEYQNAERAERR
jgi:hypothetical protein